MHSGAVIAIIELLLTSLTVLIIGFLAQNILQCKPTPTSYEIHNEYKFRLLLPKQYLSSELSTSPFPHPVFHHYLRCPWFH